MGSKILAVSTDQMNSTVNASSNSKSSNGKVPKRVNKAAREKLKREHLNDLFLELGNALELDQPNNGKASILCEATRFLKDLFGQIESLRKENVSLLSESHYVTVEKNELKEETSMLETQISELRTEIEARVNQLKPDLNAAPPLELATHFPGLPAFPGAGVQQQQPPSAPTTVLVLPVQPKLQTYHISDTMQTQTQTQTPVKQSSNVRRPNPRYPSAADSWLLEDRLRAREDVRAGGESSNGR